jgi:hypothetical protein
VRAGGFLTHTTIDEIDGSPVPTKWWQVNRGTRVEVAPGPHVLWVTCRHWSFRGDFTGDPISIELAAEAGRVYEVKTAFSEDNARWSAWIETSGGDVASAIESATTVRLERPSPPDVRDEWSITVFDDGSHVEP